MDVPAVGGLRCLMSQVLVRYPDPYYVVNYTPPSSPFLSWFPSYDTLSNLSSNRLQGQFSLFTKLRDDKLFR